MLLVPEVVHEKKDSFAMVEVGIAEVEIVAVEIVEVEIVAVRRASEIGMCAADSMLFHPMLEDFWVSKIAVELIPSLILDHDVRYSLRVSRNLRLSAHFFLQ
jgi:hypothetical protein